jgi:hypothetical protein
MTFDFSKVKAKKADVWPTDPIDLFQKLKVSDANINDLWLAQGDALREWHKNRTKADIGIVLNTGAGKTLVGLLIAQSLVNETKGKVLYVCSSIQLVEQTAEKAKGYGLDVTTYYRGGYSNDHFLRGVAPCVTTYQALVNGKSIFFRQDTAGIVFDDAHAAEHLLRDHFSLRLNNTQLGAVCSAIVGLFKPYHQKIGRAGSYGELDRPGCRRLFLVPPFEVGRQCAELLRILSEVPLADMQETAFSWEYMRDRVDLCCMLIDGRGITLTPPFIPVRSLPYFSETLRRVYLSATLAAPDAFARTFGKVPDHVVAPSTTAGECERLVVIPSRLFAEDVDVTRLLIANRKTLVLVPTYARANKWEDVALPPPRHEVSEAVVAFKADPSNSKLLLAARYDGVDLPGDTCRVMVIDDLPMGVGPLERFLWEYLNLSTTLRTAIASRIVQSFGRISRGMADHGVVFLTGERLIEWLLVPRNAATLPPFLQKQIQLGYEVSSQASDLDDLGAAVDQCLGRDEAWLKAYGLFMESAEPVKGEQDTEVLTTLAKAEADFGVRLWQRDYEAAAKALSNTLGAAFALSASTGAWHAMWLGRAIELMGDTDSARDLYARAHAAQFNVPPYPRHDGKQGNEAVPEQILEVDQQIKISADGIATLPKTLQADLAHLNGSGTAAQTEEALRALGQYLGLESTRPDKEFGTGPDVLWASPGLPALCIEVKTDKDVASRYQKKEVGQLSDHVQWVKQKIVAEEIIPLFIGPVVGVTETANPPNDFRVAALTEFHKLGARLVAALTDAAADSLPLTLRTMLLQYFRDRDLIWPACFDGIESHVLRDL